MNKTMLRKVPPKQVSTRQPATALIADDFKSFRSLLSRLLNEDAGLRIIGEASDGLAAVQKAFQLRPDLIFLDIGLPKANGLEAARQILSTAPQSKIIFVTQENSREIADAAIGLGALGYVTKIRIGSELLQAINAVLQGKQFIGSGLVGGNLNSAMQPSLVGSSPQG